MGEMARQRRAIIALAVAATVSLAGCTRTSTPTAAVASMTTATTLFCAYGGVGLVPDPLPPGYETEFAAIVVELDNPGAAVEGVSVLGAALLDGAGTPSASLRRVDHVVVLPEAPPDPSFGIFAVYLNPEGAPFDGSVPPGRTRLRMRFSLDRDPTALPARCRLELGGFGTAPLVIEGKVDGSWPT